MILKPRPKFEEIIDPCGAHVCKCLGAHSPHSTCISIIWLGIVVFFFCNSEQIFWLMNIRSFMACIHIHHKAHHKLPGSRHKLIWKDFLKIDTKISGKQTLIHSDACTMHRREKNSPVPNCLGLIFIALGKERRVITSGNWTFSNINIK